MESQLNMSQKKMQDLLAQVQTVPAVHLALSEGLSEPFLPWFSHPVHSLPKKRNQTTELTT